MLRTLGIMVSVSLIISGNLSAAEGEKRQDKNVDMSKLKENEAKNEAKLHRRAQKEAKLHEAEKKPEPHPAKEDAGSHHAVGKKTVGIGASHHSYNANLVGYRIEIIIKGPSSKSKDIYHGTFNLSEMFSKDELDPGMPTLAGILLPLGKKSIDFQGQAVIGAGKTMVKLIKDGKVVSENSFDKPSYPDNFDGYYVEITGDKDPYQASIFPTFNKEGIMRAGY